MPKKGSCRTPPPCPSGMEEKLNKAGKPCCYKSRKTKGTKVAKGTKNCRQDQIVNPKTGRCIKKNGITAKKLSLTNVVKSPVKVVQNPLIELMKEKDEKKNLMKKIKDNLYKIKKGTIDLRKHYEHKKIYTIHFVGKFKKDIEKRVLKELYKEAYEYMELNMGFEDNLEEKALEESSMFLTLGIPFYIYQHSDLKDNMKYDLKNVNNEMINFILEN